MQWAQASAGVSLRPWTGPEPACLRISCYLRPPGDHREHESGLERARRVPFHEATWHRVLRRKPPLSGPFCKAPRDAPGAGAHGSARGHRPETAPQSSRGRRVFRRRQPAAPFLLRRKRKRSEAKRKRVRRRSRARGVALPLSVAASPVRSRSVWPPAASGAPPSASSSSSVSGAAPRVRRRGGGAACAHKGPSSRGGRPARGCRQRPGLARGRPPVRGRERGPGGAPRGCPLGRAPLPFPSLGEAGPACAWLTASVRPAGAALSAPPPPPPAAAKLGCWFVEEKGGGGGGGGGSVMPSDLRQRRALLILPPPGRRLPEAALEPEVPAEVEAGLAFQLLDPSGTLWSSREPGAHPLWRGADLPDPEAEAHVSCEINPYHPREAHVPWAVGLVDQKGCPRSLEDRWVIATIQNPEVDFGVSSILHREAPLSGKRETSSVTTATAVLSIFTRTPRLRSRLGQDVLLDCGFSAPAVAFSVEWRHQYSGAGRVILAYDGAAQRMSVSEEGAQLFLDPMSSNVSLQLQAVQVHHEGIYICSIYLPHLHAQQAVELKIVEPPKATLRPVPFSVPPGTHAELACEITGYYPQSVSVVWKRHSPGMAHEVLLDTWESGHRQSPDGTYSFTSFARLPAVQPGDQGSSYSCHMTHVGLGEAGLQKAVKLHVAGSSGPSVEDVIGLFLIAFALLGFLQAISRRVFGEKEKSEKVE
ncbi:tapasin [Liasis olivaceus]